MRDIVVDDGNWVVDVAGGNHRTITVDVEEGDYDG